MGDSSEYICISCWNSFVAKPNTTGELTCPHCSYVQPAADGYLGGDEPMPPPKRMAAPPVVDPDRTVQDMQMPWVDGETRGKPAGLEPISFDDLEELEQLLGSDEPVARYRPEPEETEPPASMGEEAAQAPDEPGEPAAPAEPLQTSVIWRLKSASGLTYSFYAVRSLLLWAEGLGRPQGVLVSLDGITWKPFDRFKQALGDGLDGAGAVGAFEGTAAEERAAEPIPANGSATQSGRDSRAQPRRTASAGRPASTGRPTSGRNKGASRPTVTTTSERSRAPSAAGTPERAGAEKAPARGQARPSGRAASNRRAATGALAGRTGESAASAAWPGRLIFLALGALVGGAGVYFGMYLLGFYELQLPW